MGHCGVDSSSTFVLLPVETMPNAVLETTSESSSEPKFVDSHSFLLPDHRGSLLECNSSRSSWGLFLLTLGFLSSVFLSLGRQAFVYSECFNLDRLVFLGFTFVGQPQLILCTGLSSLRSSFFNQLVTQNFGVFSFFFFGISVIGSPRKFFFLLLCLGSWSILLVLGGCQRLFAYVLLSQFTSCAGKSLGSPCYWIAHLLSWLRSFFPGEEFVSCYLPPALLLMPLLPLLW
jgi:hypothetical protein